MRSGKIFLLTLFVLGVYKSEAQKEEIIDSLVSISYSASGMISRFNLFITENKIVYEIQNSRQEVDVTYERRRNEYNWLSAVEIVSQINLDSLNKIKSTTDYRSVDGAMYSILTIVTKSNTYKTKSFDNGFPMKEILPLIAWIDDLINFPLIISNLH